LPIVDGTDAGVIHGAPEVADHDPEAVIATDPDRRTA